MLSVIIPVYNNERYLITTLSHIRNAKYRDLEIIIVDDGSSDKSLDIAYKIQKGSQILTTIVEAKIK